LLGEQELDVAAAQVGQFGGRASTETHFTAPGFHLRALSVNKGQPPIRAQPLISGCACITCSIFAAASCGVSLW